MAMTVEMIEQVDNRILILVTPSNFQEYPAKTGYVETFILMFGFCYIPAA
jgi:hypothetical protein